MFRKLFAPHRLHRLLRPYIKLTLELLEDRLAPATYSLTDLSPLQVDANTGPWPGGQAINNSGEVVGSVPLPSGDSAAVLYNNGQLTNLGTLNNFSSPGIPTHYNPLAINNAGEVVGVAENSGAFEAFVYSGGPLTALTPSPSTGQLFASSAIAINKTGQIAGGGIIIGGGGIQAFLYSNGSPTYLGSLSGGVAPSPTAINDSGQIVGFATVANGTQHAFLYSNGQLTDLGTLAGNTSKSEALAINASGQLVGFSQVASGGQHAFLYSNGTMTDLGVPSGFVSSEADGINASGQIVGSATMSNGVSEAFVYNNGTWSNLNQFVPTGSSFILTNALGINDNGQIVAEGGNLHSYFLTQGTPPPPPSPLPPPPPPPPPPNSSTQSSPQDLTDRGVAGAISQSGINLEALLRIGIDAGQEFLSSAPALFNGDNPDNPTYQIPVLLNQLAAQNSGEASALYQDFANWMFWAYVGTWTVELDLATGKSIDPQVAANLITNIENYAQLIQQNPLSGSATGWMLMAAEAEVLGADYDVQQIVGLLKAASSGSEGELFTLKPVLPV